MGNKPSLLTGIPQGVSQAVSNVLPAGMTPPPPTIPVCDANCQRQKELTALKTALDSATANKISDPETYQKARIAYYTKLEGQDWLTKERTRIGEEEVAPLANQLSEKYKSLIDEKKSQSSFLGLLDVLKAENEQNKEELKYIYDQTAQNTDLKNTMDRKNELGGNTLIDVIGSFYPLLFQVLIAILAIIILVLLYRRFVPTTTPVPVGGKRLPH